MAIVVEKLLAIIGWKADSSGLRKLQREGERTQRAVGSKLQRAAAGSERSITRLGTRGAASMGKATAEAGKLEGKLSKVKLAAAAALAAVGAGAVKGFGEAVRANKEFEASMAILTTVVGKAKAPEVFKDLETFARTTPFKLNEVVNLYSKLSGLGFKLSFDDLRALGDIAAVSQKSLSELGDMMAAARRGSAEMVDNFATAGLFGKKEKGKLELTSQLAGLKKSIDPSDTKALLEFFVAAGKAKGVEGGMEKLSQTLGGMMGRMADQADAFLREMGKGGFNEGLRAFFNDVMSTGEGSDGLARTLGVVLGGALKALGKAVKFLRSNWKFLAAGFGALLSVLFPLLGPLALLALVLDDIRVYAQGGDSMLGRFIKKFKEAPGPAGMMARLMLKVFGLIKQGLRWLQINGPVIISMIKEQFEGLTSGGRFERFKNIVMRVFEALLRVAGPFIDVLAVVLPPVLKLLLGLFLLLLAVAAPVLETLADMVEWVAEAFASVVEAIAPVTEAIYSGLVGPLEAALGIADKLAGKFAAFAGIDVGGFAAGLSASGGARTAGIAAAGAAARVGAGGTTNTSTNTNSVVNNVSFTVTEAQANAAGGPAGVAGATVSSLNAKNVGAGAG